jgi:plasmid stabilization system protein ParE
MRVSWTTLANDDLSRIVRRIRQDNPAAARNVAKILYDSGFDNRNRSPRCGLTHTYIGI